MKKCLIFILLIWQCHVFAQEKSARFERISTQQGLSQSSVLCMLQDTKGFLWFGTSNGLNRYDGYKFKVYSKDLTNIHSIESNYITALAEDRRGLIWIGTRNSLSCFNPRNDRFSNYYIDSLHSAFNYISMLIPDDKGQVWLINREGGFFKFDPVKRQFKSYHLPIPGQGSLRNAVTALTIDKQGFIWLGTAYGMFRFEPAKEKFLSFAHDPADPHSLSDTHVTGVFTDVQGELWIGTHSGGINRLDKNSGKFKRYPVASQNPSLYNRVSVFYETRSGELWLGGYGKGLSKFNKFTGQITHYQNQPGDLYSLSDNDVISMLEDRSGILWIGTYGGGINKLDIKNTNFIHFGYNTGASENFLQNGVTAVVEDKHKNLWIGTESEGLTHYNLQTGKFTNYRHEPHNPGTLPDNHIYALLEDHDGTIWIGTRNHLVRMQNGVFYPVALPSPASSAFFDHTIHTIYQDRKGELWIGTSMGLYRMETSTGQIKHYAHARNQPQSLSNNNILTINEDGNGVLWIGTEGGLNRMEGEKFIHYRREPGSTSSLSENKITVLHRDDYGALWIGTSGGGLNRYDKKSDKFQYITAADGIANNMVYGIIEDKQNNLWMSSNHGLMRYNVVNKSVRNYDVHDGLQSEEFNERAFHKGRSGMFYFGSINGLIAFYPDSIESEIFVPPIIITDFKLFNKSVEPGRNQGLTVPITVAEHIDISYKYDVFSLEFAALNYSAPQKTRYCYKMEGFDEGWIYTDAQNRIATYTNLPYGTYRFMVKATNSNGTWNESGAGIEITIHPPFWLTWWFSTLMALLVVGALLTWYRVRMARIIQQRLVLEELIKLRTEEIMLQKEQIEVQRNDLDLQKKQLEAQYIYLQDINEKLQKSENELSELNAAKNKFFSILAHDLRSPLNSLSGFSSLLAMFADELTRDEIKKTAHDLDINVKNALKYLENLLTWARAQMDSIESDPQLLPLRETVQVSVELLQGHAAGKNIEVEVEIPGQVQVYADKPQLNTIITNLLTNAIKFSLPGGKVSISCHALDGFTEIRVKDTGVGMPEEVMHKIFRIDSKHTTPGTKGEKGTGLGLLLCKEFVERNGGKIWVESTYGKGSVFHFTMPVEKTIA